MEDKTNTRAPTASIPPFGLRMQPELKAQIESAAKANGRSMNAEIVARLDQSFRLPAMVDRIVEAKNIVDESDAEKDALIARLLKVSDAQKEISDMQEHIIN